LESQCSRRSGSRALRGPFQSPGDQVFAIRKNLAVHSSRRRASAAGFARPRRNQVQRPPLAGLATAHFASGEMPSRVLANTRWRRPIRIPQKHGVIRSRHRFFFEQDPPPSGLMSRSSDHPNHPARALLFHPAHARIPSRSDWSPSTPCRSSVFQPHTSALSDRPQLARKVTPRGFEATPYWCT